MTSEFNPYIQPGKHFRPQQKQYVKHVAHKGTWNLMYGDILLSYNLFYGECVKAKKEWNRHKDYRDIERFRIVPCL